VLLHPIVEQARDLQIVLFQHHHVALAGDPLVLEPPAVGLDPGLIEVFGGASAREASCARSLAAVGQPL
jgi:hypothetical protein